MRARHAVVYWTGFGITLALLIAAPLVLPEFWRRFLTEILIWGLLAMSSDILIGYTGMVSFGHSGTDGENHCKHPRHRDAHRLGHHAVLRCRADPDAEGAEFEEQPERADDRRR